MIYCGYQGSGKTTYCRNNPTTTYDLDSSTFVKDEGWEQEYVQMAMELSERKDVFISAHKIVIEHCIKKKIEFAILAPSMNKDSWRARLTFRYNKKPTLANLKALIDFEQNFDNDINYYKSLENQGVKVHWIEATVITNLSEKISKKA